MTLAGGGSFCLGRRAEEIKIQDVDVCGVPLLAKNARNGAPSFVVAAGRNDRLVMSLGGGFLIGGGGGVEFGGGRAFRCSRFWRE